MKRIIYLFIVSSFLLNASLTAQKKEWVTAVGRAHGANVTPEEGKKLALEAARTEAIKNVVGIQINEETFRKISESIVDDKKRLYDVFGRLSQSNSFGRITKENKLKEWIDIENGLPVYKVEIEAHVEEELGENDPSFSVEVIMPKDVFYVSNNAGEELKFKIVATKNCYIYLFNILSNDSVQVLMPNKFIINNSYYPEKDKQAFEEMLNNISFNVFLPFNSESTLEALYVVATKDRLNFYSGDLDRNYDGMISTYQIALTDIQKWLIKIPRKDRTETIKQFEIRKK